MPTPIQELAEKMEEARGLDYQVAQQALRDYAQGLSDTAFLYAMTRVDNPNIFRYLWSIGLSYKKQQIAIMRWKELTK